MSKAHVIADESLNNVAVMAIMAVYTLLRLRLRVRETEAENRVDTSGSGGSGSGSDGRSTCDGGNDDKKGTRTSFWTSSLRRSFKIIRQDVVVVVVVVFAIAVVVLIIVDVVVYVVILGGVGFFTLTCYLKSYF